MSAGLERSSGAREPYRVLFLCEGNSVRSLFGECLAEREGSGRLRAFSAGRNPVGAVHPLALRILREHGHDTSRLRSKSWSEFLAPDAPRMDFILTVCHDFDAEDCPTWPGGPITARWDIEDPTLLAGPELERLAAFTRAYRELLNRIRVFASLSFESLDRLSLLRRLSEIGKGD